MREAGRRLHRVTQGVYAVGWPGLTPERRWMAAVLACGPEAALSHRSAAAPWGIRRENGPLVDVSMRRRHEVRRSGIAARSRPSLPAEDVGVHRGIPVTQPARTLLDLATELGALESFAGEPGVRVLRTLLDRRTFRLSDSDLELLFRPIAAAAGLPQPLTKAWVNGFEVDFYHWQVKREAAHVRDILTKTTHRLTAFDFSRDVGRKKSTALD